MAADLNGVSRSLNITTPKADVSPRIGLAYSVNEKTVIRAAFGTFYGTIFQNLGGQLAYPGYDNTITHQQPGDCNPPAPLSVAGYPACASSKPAESLRGCSGFFSR